MFIHESVSEVNDLRQLFFPPDSFIRFAPVRRKRARKSAAAVRACPTPKPDVWQPMAGRLAAVADIATQAAKAARSRDPGALDRLIDAFKDAVCDANRFCRSSIARASDQRRSARRRPTIRTSRSSRR
jgi:hypothetical protein